MTRSKGRSGRNVVPRDYHAPCRDLDELADVLEVLPLDGGSVLPKLLGVHRHEPVPYLEKS